MLSIFIFFFFFSFFFLMIRRPPISTLCPYTPLFRSPSHPCVSPTQIRHESLIMAQTLSRNKVTVDLVCRLLLEKKKISQNIKAQIRPHFTSPLITDNVRMNSQRKSYQSTSSSHNITQTVQRAMSQHPRISVSHHM